MSRRHLLVTFTAALAIAAAAAPALSQTQRPSRRAAEAPSISTRIDSLVAARMAEHDLAGLSAAVIRGSDTLVYRGWGLADSSAARPATAETTYRIGSASKQFTAVLLLRMVERGRLSLTDSIGGHLDKLRPEWRPLAVGQILNHTSGLHRDFRRGHEQEKYLSSDSLLALARIDGMAFAPGTDWGYSNTGYMLLGVLVEKLYGKPYAAVLKDELAEPLGLAGLGWCTETEPNENAAVGYHVDDGARVHAMLLETSLSLGSGGICASAGDLAAWNRALHGGRVLSPSSYEAMTTPVGAATARGYGFGLMKRATSWGTTVLEHDGATAGFVAENAWFPAESLSVTLLYNTTPPPRDGGFADAVARVVLGE